MPWRPHALELARQLRAEQPDISELLAVAEIARRWEQDRKACPGTGRLLRALREWEADGKLAPRRK